MLSFDGPFDPPFGGRMRGACAIYWPVEDAVRAAAIAAQKADSLNVSAIAQFIQ